MNDKLYFYSNSKNCFPGKGVNEFVKNPDEYKVLSLINNWRKILSNFHEYKFIYDNKYYNSIEHAFQATKFNLFNKNIGKLFECNNEIGNLSPLDARKNRKIIILNKEQLDIWNIIKDDIMNEISIKKYEQCIEYRNVLDNTNNAELWHIQIRHKPVRFIHLENIRLNNKKN